LTAVKEHVQEQLSLIAGIASDIMEGKFVDAFKKAAELVLNDVRFFYDTINNLTSGRLGAFLTSVSEHMANFKTIVVDRFKETLNAAREAAAKFHEIGKIIVDSLVSGLSNLGSRMKEIVDNAISGVNSKLTDWAQGHSHSLSLSDIPRVASETLSKGFTGVGLPPIAVTMPTVPTPNKVLDYHPTIQIEISGSGEIDEDKLAQRIFDKLSTDLRTLY